MQLVRCPDCYGLVDESKFRFKLRCSSCQEWYRKNPSKLPPGAILYPPEPVDGYVYVIHDGRFSKIGITVNLRTRYSSIRTHNPTAELVWYISVPRSRMSEQRAHFRLKEHHVDGEWFSVPAETAIEAVCAVTGGIGVYADKEDFSLWGPIISAPQIP